MAFQGDSFQRNSFQPSAGPIDNPPPGKQVLEPYAPNELFEWQPRWSLIQQMASSVGFLDAAANPPFPGSFVLAAVSLIVGGSWVAADPLPQLPQKVAAVIPVQAASAHIPPGLSAQQAALNNLLPPDPGPTLNANAQPYQPRVVTPPQSVPQNSPFVGGARITQDQLSQLVPPFDPSTVQVARNLVSKLLVSDPPFVGGARIPQSGLVWFVPTIPDPMPQQAGKVIESTITNNPPFMGGAQVPLPVLIGWIPPPPDPIMGMGGGQPQPLTPTKVIESTVRNYPPPSRVYEAPLPVLDAWIPPDPAPIVARNLTPPSNPVGAILQGPVTQDLATYIDWLPPDPAPITARNLTPPSGPVVVTYVPPQRAGTVELLNTWDEGPEWEIVLYFSLPQPAAPQNPFARYPFEVHTSWLPSDPAFQQGARLTPPQSGPPPQNPPIVGSRVQQAILNGWIPIDQPLLTPAKLASGAVPFTVGSFVPQTVIINWLPPTPDPFMGRWQQLEGEKLVPPQSGPAPTNPPFPGTKVPTEVNVAWIPPPPQPIVGPPLIFGAAQPSQPPIKGAQVGIDVLVTWIPPDPMFQVGAKRTPPSGPVFVPPAYRPIGEAMQWWAIPPPQPIVGAKLTPPSNPVPDPLRGSVVHPAVGVWWSIPDPPQPSQTAPVTALLPPAPPPPNRLYQLPLPVRMWWDIPPPEPIVVKNLSPPIAGPPPQNPPFMGGAAIPLPVLIDWIPPPPQPPAAIGLVSAFPLAQPLQIDPRFVTWPPARTTVTSTSRTEVSYGQARITTFTPPSSGAPRANDLSPIDATEVTNDVFDFGPWLEANQTIVAIASTSCVAVSGTDASAAARIIGSPSIVASPKTSIASQAVLQRAGQMVAGVLYRLTATVTTSDGQTMTMYGHQLCGVGEFQTSNLPPALDFSRAEDSQYIGIFI